MKIGIEVQRLFRKKKYGIETSALELIKKLREQEPHHEFVIFAKHDADMQCLSESSNVKIRTVAGRYFLDFEQFFLPLAARHEQVDVLHCTGNTAPYFSPVPVVQTLHDIIFMDPISQDDCLYQRWGNHYRRKVVPLVTPKSKMVITVSEFEKNRIVTKLGIPEEKVHVVYNGLNHERFNLNYEPLKKHFVQAKYKLPDEFILFLGNTAYRKNPFRALEAYVKYAAKEKNPLPLVTPGLSREFVMEKLRQLEVSFNPDRFITPGYIHDHDLPFVYRLSKVFLFPSLSEGFGMPVLEAMATGTPVITSATTSIPEIAGGAAILTNPLNSTSIADAITLLAKNEEVRIKKIKEGLSNVKRFSWDFTASQVMRIYQAVVEHAPVRQPQPSRVSKQIYIVRE